MRLKTATTIAIVCLALNLVGAPVLRLLWPISSGAPTSAWIRHLYGFASFLQVLLLNGPLLLFFVVLRSKQE